MSDTDTGTETLENKLSSITLMRDNLKWRKITQEGLDVDYTMLFSRSLSDMIMKNLDETVEYYTGKLAQVKVFGKLHPIPRLQAAYGDPEVRYEFSGISLMAKPWLPVLKLLRDVVENATGFHYNFVLINKYRDGNDHIGEHRDNEKEIDKKTPIASLTLGQQRTFVFRHGEARLKGKLKRALASVKIELECGSLLLMNPPTNKYWYHSLPPRKKLTGARINLTFRNVVPCEK
ncbi:hypothetical protein GWI33_006699 [Rhynchophorus ferrugineus]|uniref:DNA oxidative demethylase ALKBH2 n=1 Tax=Rhynchophorus ferrugineus TaxID=354439 RepID=A0A834IIC6_RHYFE|nr:hypothetical protein GWI33_006699 [Rhynchophorus ferrugineus]